jgi:Rrf2 family transcriptional regulator, cysteine metabolism repressor
MKLSKKCEYAIRALVCLCEAHDSQVLAIQTIARREGIPKKFLEQVLLALKKAGLVQSSRGKAGGYALQVAPINITVRDIMHAVDGPLAPLPCASRSAPVKCADCVDMERCWLRAVMVEVGDALNDLLDHTTLEIIHRRAAASRRSSTAAPMYHI